MEYLQDLKAYDRILRALTSLSKGNQASIPQI